MIGDRYFSVGVVQGILLQSEFTPTYTYHLEHEGGFSIGLLMASTQSIFPVPIKYFFNVVGKWFREAILGQDVPHMGMFFLF